MLKYLCVHLQHFEYVLQVIRMIQNGNGRNQLERIHHHVWHRWLNGSDQQRNSLH